MGIIDVMLGEKCMVIISGKRKVSFEELTSETTLLVSSPLNKLLTVFF